MEPVQPLPAPPRPQLITNLGILSFINSGLFLFIYALGILGMAGVQSMSREEFDALMQPQVDLYFNGPGMEQLVEMMGLMYEHGLGLAFILFLRTALRLAGVLGMWRGRLWGFHVYAAAQLAGIFAPHVFLPWAYLGIGGPLLAVAMTALYGTQRSFLS